MVFTAIMAVPLGIAAALYLEEFADPTTRWNRFVEVNLQNLAAVPAIVYGLLAVAIMALLGFQNAGIVLGGALALALLILPVIIITTREAVRAVPREIRQGSLALGATVWQTTWKQTLPSAIPGIATGTILGLSRAIGEAAPLVVVGLAGSLLFDPDGRDEQHHRAPDADLLLDVQLARGAPSGGVRSDHRAPGDGPRPQRTGHLHPQQVPAILVRETSDMASATSADTFPNMSVARGGPHRQRAPAPRDSRPTRSWRRATSTSSTATSTPCTTSTCPTAATRSPR